MPSDRRRYIQQRVLRILRVRRCVAESGVALHIPRASLSNRQTQGQTHRSRPNIPRMSESWRLLGQCNPKAAPQTQCRGRHSESATRSTPAWSNSSACCICNSDLHCRRAAMVLFIAPPTSTIVIIMQARTAIKTAPLRGERRWVRQIELDRVIIATSPMNLFEQKSIGSLERC